MFIQTEDTPNPDTLKFMPGTIVLNKGTADFSNSDSANDSPLASRLFTIDGVSRVFLASDFISVTKQSELDWNVLKPSILTGIMEHFSSGLPFLNKSEEDNTEYTNSEDNETIKQIKDLLETRVRPAVAMDGGDIRLKSYKDGVAEVLLKGACAGCPSSTVTLKHGVERMIKHYVPEVNSVEAFNINE